MANKLMRKLGFGSYADQLSITGSYSSPGSDESLGWEAAPTPSYSTPTARSDTGAWANVAATAITVAGRTASSIWAPQPETPVAPAYPGASMPTGSVMGSIDSKILLIGGIAVLGIVLMLAMKK